MRPASSLRRRWTAAFVVGELGGFVPPAVVGATLGAAGAGAAVMVLALTAAGALEGLVLGLAQARVLTRHAPVVDGRRWVVATAAAAAFAWFVGMGGSALGGEDQAPSARVLVVLIPAWAAGLLAMGFLQWLVLRRAVPRSGRWVWVTAGAWLVGVAVAVAAISLTPNAWSVWAHVVTGVAGAVAMGLVVGSLTGATLARLLAGRPDLDPATGRPSGTT